MTNDDRRPDPDALLASARADDEKHGHGELRVYLGMCPGVGKTYTMLDEARRLARDGRRVLVGVVETHGRVETEALLVDLEVLPRREVAYRGTALKEFDIDAALGRRPELVLLDELAHTNAPGSRHPKRWHDVRELVESGIDVWTTVNIQHVESLRDAVAKITGVQVQETVPDSCFDLADEVRLIDLTPDQLRQRLREGRVYLGERARVAGENFFREGNLSALREMALRFTAQRVDREMRDYMRRHLIVGPWRFSERLLVAVGSSPYSERLIRLTRRLAGTLHASWLAVHVDSGGATSEADRARLASNLALARSLGAEVVSVSGEDTAAAILDVARRENVSQIVAGKPLSAASPWWRQVLLWRTSIADRLARGSGDIDVVLVHPADSAAPRERTIAVHEHIVPSTRGQDWLVAAGLLCGTTAAGLLGESWIGYRSIPLLYLLVVTVSGLWLQRWAVLALAVGSALAWNFFFTDPRRTFAMLHREDVFLWLAFLAVACVVGHLTTRLLRREHASHEGEERSRSLYQLTRVIAASVDFGQGVRQALRQVEEVFACEAALLVLQSDGELETIAGVALTEHERSVCHWSATRRQASGRFTETLPESPVLAIPLLAAGESAGVLAVRPRDEALRSPVRRDLLDAFGTHLSVLIEKEGFQRSAREARVAAASQKLQRALLDHVSHELKTPVAVIQAAVQRLRAAEPEDAALHAEIDQATRRLNRVVTQLLTLSRVEAGLIEPKFEVCDALDLLQEVVGGLGEQADRVRIEAGTFEFRADPSLLHTSLSNLLHNALQHSPPGAFVLVQAVKGADGGVDMRVSDQGPGVPAGERGRIFERFGRGVSAHAGGMGLGLSIARHFVEAQGGSLELEDTSTGATFRISLPREPSSGATECRGSLTTTTS